MLKKLIPSRLPPPLPVAEPAPPPAVRDAEAEISDEPDPTPIPAMSEPHIKNVLARDVEIKGSIRFQNDLLVDGKIEGEIVSDGLLTVGENAEIKGEIHTKSVIVLGKVNGNITVHERCELKSKAQLIGDLQAARVVIEEGATFVGRSEVTPNKVAMPKPEVVRGDDKVAAFNPR